MGIKHRFVNLITDIGGPTYTQPTHWNDTHQAPPFTVYSFDAGMLAASFGIASNGPNATGVEFPNLDTAGVGRGAFDFTFVDTVRMGVGLGSWGNTGGVTGGSVALRAQYMASGFPGSWYSFDATGGSGPFVSVATNNNASQYLASTNGMMLSASVTVSAAAKALPQPLTVRVAGYGGNGSAIGVGQVNVWAF